MTGPRAEQPEMASAANHMMRRTLHELEKVRALAARHAEETRSMREGVRKALIDLEREARAHVSAFTPRDLGEELRLDIKHKFVLQGVPGRREPEPPPETFEAARDEWAKLAAFAEQDVRELVSAKTLWEHKVFKRRRDMPTVPLELWRTTERLSEIHAALPALRERYVAERLDTKAHLNDDLAAEIERRGAAIEQAFASAREVLRELEAEAGLTGGSWGHPGWLDATPAQAIQRVIRVGEFDPGLPEAAGVGPVPALLEFPFHAGVAIATDVAHRASAIELARALVLRTLAATPPGDVRLVFIDPVSIGQAVAEFRHLAEFDERLVDTKTWTSERDIESRLEELSDHLEVVISTYLRGQFDSIDEYNRQAGEVAEPYRVLVVFDYPTGFTGRSARQLLSLIENGPRCGVHTLLVYDRSHKPPDEVPFDRLVHSMQRIDLTQSRGVTLPEPIGKVDLDFLPDTTPPISFAPDGQPTSPFGRLLLEIGSAARSAHSGPVTIERVLPIVNKQIASGRSRQAPQVLPGAPELAAGHPETWWSGVTAEGAYAPIGRAGAQDLAAMYFSSTEIAGGSLVVGLPRSGKSTALHAAIVSLSMLYAPEELELYLIDSKHGVEFKVYDRLPHARLVSINSEREFSVSVLQSLDGEIRRRAELMKQRTAGKANITEYRAATGEQLPRIVLFMDEFHEVFEEDDAVGQEAFQAFSNIVRQGPFAGVHVVVSSQTLSSMPAMDRGTLSLLPMRVAFMCNEADADLVMGDTNREVKALSQQGEGIFNPARGDPSHNKLFRGLYVAPDERDALLGALAAKADAAGFKRRPRVFDGDTLAARPSEPAPGTPTRPVFALGEPFNLDSSAGIALRRGRGANILLVGAGDEDENPDASIDGAMHSCIADAIAEGLAVNVVDFIGDPGTGDDALDLMSLCDVLGTSYRRASALADVLAEVAAEIGERREASDYGRAGRLLVLNGVQRALDLAPEDPYAEPGDDGPDTAGQLAAVLREGPEVGCHVAVVVDRLAQFDRRLGREMLKEFDWRVAGSVVSPADVTVITESYTEAEIRHSQLLLVDHGRGRSRRVRAYPRHNRASIRQTTTQGTP
jgi:DNA segregation ATPase FtsK/SpoIIIE, S-DNA-T family